jgi:hypothetical protein
MIKTSWHTFQEGEMKEREKRMNEWDLKGTLKF